MIYTYNNIRLILCANARLGVAAIIVKNMHSTLEMGTPDRTNLTQERFLSRIVYPCVHTSACA